MKGKPSLYLRMNGLITINDEREPAGPSPARIVCGAPSRGIFLAKQKKSGWSLVT